MKQPKWTLFDYISQYATQGSVPLLHQSARRHKSDSPDVLPYPHPHPQLESETLPSLAHLESPLPAVKMTSEPGQLLMRNPANGCIGEEAIFYTLAPTHTRVSIQRPIRLSGRKHSKYSRHMNIQTDTLSFHSQPCDKYGCLGMLKMCLVTPQNSPASEIQHALKLQKPKKIYIRCGSTTAQKSITNTIKFHLLVKTTEKKKKKTCTQRFLPSSFSPPQLSPSPNPQNTLSSPAHLSNATSASKISTKPQPALQIKLLFSLTMSRMAPLIEPCKSV